MLLTWATTSLYQAVLGLFSSGASGVFLDANDWGTSGTNGTGVVFQDLSGTPVTAMEQPVQLILDKSQGLKLGSELVVNGSNPTATTGWTPNVGSTLTVAANKFRVQGQESYQAFATTVGALYKCSVDIAVVNPGAVYIGNAPRNAANYTTGQVAASATKSFYFIATATTTYVSMLPWNAGVEYCDFNNFTIKQIAGNHAYVTASANRPTISAMYNLLTKTEKFDDAVWSKYAAGGGSAPVVTPDQAIAPNGTLTADKVVFVAPASGDQSMLRQSITVSGSNKGAVYIQPFSSGDIGKSVLIRQAGAAAYTALTLVAGWQLLTSTETGSGSTFEIGLRPSEGSSTGTVSVYLWGADLRPSDQATGLIPTYQMVNTPTDYDWSPAFPPMIKGNGANTYLTGNLDLSSTNKATVWAGVRKTSDATYGYLFELSANAAANAGAFFIDAPNTNATPDYGFLCKGSSASFLRYAPAGLAAPRTNVLSCVFDLSQSAVTGAMSPRVNGVLSQSNPSGTGTGGGNFGNYPYTIGCSGGLSAFMNGGFNTIIILGAAATAAQISMTESWCDQGVKAY